MENERLIKEIPEEPDYTELELEELEPVLLEMFRSRKFAQLKSILAELNAADIGEMLQDFADEEDIQEDELPKAFRILPKDLAADVFVEMEPDMQEILIKAFSDRELQEILDDMFVDDTVDIIEEMPANVVARILESVDSSTRSDINKILKYEEDSAGSIMTTEYIHLLPDNTVREAFAHIREAGVESESIYNCYVTEKKKLIGIVTVKDLLLHDYDDVIADFMEDNVISVTTRDDKEDVAQMFAKYDFTALPVVDMDDRLVGIVTIDDAVDVMTEEATEDIEKMAAITPSEHPYLRTSTFETWKQRIPWLLLLMISATFTGMIITKFESALAAQVALTAFIPMLMDTGGNCGSQASVTIIRGLSLGEIEFSDIVKVIWKEIRVAVLCGVTLAAVGFCKIILIDRLMMGNSDITPMIAGVVSLTVVVTVILAKVVGCVLPLFTEKLGFDPAVMASPFITTIVDALSLMIYMNFATLLLGL